MSNVNQNVTVRLLAENKTQAAFGQLNQSLNNLKTTVLTVAGAFAGAFALREVIDTTRRWGNEVDRLQDELGLAAEEASKLNFIAHSVGVTNDELSTTFGMLNKKIADSAEAIIKGTSDFDKWGISLKNANGDIVGFDEAMRRIKTRFQEVGQNAQGSALLMDIFGRSGKTLSDFLALTDAEMKVMIEDAQRMGLVLGGSASEALQSFNRQMYRLDLQLTALKLMIGQFILPLVSALITKFVEWMGRVKQVADGIGKLLGPLKEFIDKHGGVKAIADALLAIGVALLGLAAVGALVALIGFLGRLVVMALPLAAVAGGLLLVGGGLLVVANALMNVEDPGQKVSDILGGIGATLAGLALIMLPFNAPAAVVIGALSLVFMAAKEVLDTIRLIHDNWDLLSKLWREGKLDDIPVLGGILRMLRDVTEAIEETQRKWQLFRTEAAGFGQTPFGTPNPRSPEGREGGGTTLPRGFVPPFTLPIIPHAEGGIFTKPHLGLVAENGPEAIVPLGRGGGVGGLVVNFNAPISANSPSEVADMIGDELMRRIFAQRNFAF